MARLIKSLGHLGRGPVTAAPRSSDAFIVQHLNPHPWDASRQSPSRAQPQAGFLVPGGRGAAAVHSPPSRPLQTHTPLGCLLGLTASLAPSPRRREGRGEGSAPLGKGCAACLRQIPNGEAPPPPPRPAATTTPSSPRFLVPPPATAAPAPHTLPHSPVHRRTGQSAGDQGREPRRYRTGRGSKKMAAGPQRKPPKVAER